MTMAESEFKMRVRATRQSALVQIKVQIQHPIHNGVAKDDFGNIPAAHYITRVQVQVNGVLRVRADIGPGVSRNPMFGWRLTDVAPGSEVGVAWQDNQGFSGHHAVVVT